MKPTLSGPARHRDLETRRIRELPQWGVADVEAVREVELHDAANRVHPFDRLAYLGDALRHGMRRRHSQ
jgi:hypothetical protein